MLSLIVGLVLVLLSTLGAWYAVHQYRAAKLEWNWVAVPGRVLHSAVQQVGDKFEPAVKYSYSFRGTSLTGDRIRSTDISTELLERVEAEVAKYPAGSEITVFVNPEMPTDSVVDRGTRKWFLPGTLVGGAFTAYIGLRMIWKSLS
jgi:hypothetical protein